jgi:hypothetical protein
VSATALAQRPGISRGEIDSLLESAVAGLVPMFDAKANLWCSRMVRTEDRMVPTGLSRRYTVMTLLGLHRTVKSGRPIPFDIDSVVDALVHEPNWPENLGDLGLLIWLCADVVPDKLKEVLTRYPLDTAVDRFPDGQQRRTMELSWFLSGLAHAAAALNQNVDKLANVARSVFSLLKCNRGTHGTFGHQRRDFGLEGLLRGRIGSFADQVYPIYGLAHFARIFQVDEAMGMSVACAGQICRLQGPLGQWWWHYDTDSGSVSGSYPVYSVHQHGMAPFALFALSEHSGKDFDEAILRGLRWIYGDNELHADMRDTDSGAIWRCIKGSGTDMYRQRMMSLLGIRTRSGSYGNMRVLHECWPYELGWLLYAFAGRESNLE